MADPTAWSPDGLHAALDANENEPYGRARTARAEALLDAADRMGLPEVQMHALHAVLSAYQHGGERFRSPVPFARILKLWDEHGSGLEDADYWSYSTHWMFKWVTADLLLVPEVPLATIRGFVDDMERRYRLAGYGMRAVHAERFYVASHLGDIAEAELHHAKWLASERDRMSDCQACEHNALGVWRAERGDDEEALGLWGRTVSGELTCLEEPACTLAETLKPLLRLGRYDEARTNHLRGYRLARGNPALRGTIAQHIEFCALTGNEGRGLEILGEHRGWFEGPVEPARHLDFLACVALLLRRLVARGSTDLPVAGPAGSDWAAAGLLKWVEGEIATIGAKFDARNGNDAVSARAAATENQDPLMDRLSLGVRSALPRPKVLPVPKPEPIEPEDPAELLVEARRQFELGHPETLDTWERLAALAEERGFQLDLHAKAQLAEERASDALDADEPGAASELIGKAITFYDEAGMLGRATALRSRLLITEAMQQDSYTPADPGVLADVYARVHDLHERGHADAEDVVIVRRSQAFEARRAVEAESGDRESLFDRYLEAAEDLLRDAEELGLPARMASAHYMRGELALRRENPEAAILDLLAAAELFERAGRPWANLQPRMLLAQAYMALGRDEDAEQAGLAVLAIAERWPGLAFAEGYTRQTLANAAGSQGRFEDSARHALEAAAWADRQGDGELAAGSRYTLAFAYEQLGRDADAAAVLESALPEMTRHLDDSAVVNAHWTLGRCLTRLEDYRGAAEQYLLAAAIAETFHQQDGHAMLAASAGHALRAAGLVGEARKAFGKAVDLLRGLDDPINLAKTLRALAWAEFNSLAEDAAEDEREGVLDAVLLLFAEAQQVLEVAKAARKHADARRVISYELAETDDQLARLHLNADLAERAMPYAERAAEGFKALLPQHGVDYDFSEQMVAWLLERFGSREEAIARLRTAIAVCEKAGVAAVRCAGFLEQLED